MLYLILGAVVISAGGVLFAVLSMFQKGNEVVEDRLANLTQNSGRGAQKEIEVGHISLLKDGEDNWEELIKRLLPIGQMVELSGLNVTLSKLVVMSLVSAGVLTVGGYILLPPQFKLLSIVLGLMVLPLPLAYVWWCKNKRMNEFGKQLPAAMDLMGQALRAGQSLPAAIQLVGEQVADPLGPEFHYAFEQQNLGVSVTETLREMTQRIPNLDLRFFATAVILQRQTGGDLAEILDKIAHLTRERYQIKGQIQALTGEGRISGVVLLGLPPVLFCVMLRINYDYVTVLFEHPLGQWMLGGGILLQFVGAYAIKKIIDIKV